MQDGYKIVSFDDDDSGVDGRVLDAVYQEPTDVRSVSDMLLRWHYRQAVLADMRGAGEPVFEVDFLSGSGMIGVIRSEPQPAQRTEFELFSRFIGAI